MRVGISLLTLVPGVVGDSDELVEAVETVLDEPQPLVERGRDRASRFTWEACAREHDRVYRALGA